MKIFVSMVVCLTFICLVSFATARPRGGFSIEPRDGSGARGQVPEEGNKASGKQFGYGGFGGYPYGGYGGYGHGGYGGYGYGGYGGYGGLGYGGYF
ncbi:shematrin-like protein 2 [Artemia franciscana]|uniref:shematrin-like protein 2 n=1 Tax=Artemia franciscana TaxID=6661 RepID=UPI0032DBCE0A